MRFKKRTRSVATQTDPPPRMIWCDWSSQRDEGESVCLQIHPMTPTETLPPNNCPAVGWLFLVIILIATITGIFLYLFGYF